MLGNIAIIALKSDAQIQDSVMCNKFPESCYFIQVFVSNCIHIWPYLHSSFGAEIVVTPQK